MIEANGWRLVAQRGSHQQYKHPIKSGRVTVPGNPGKEVPIGTLHSILRQAGLK
jgi:predicted RNA binding protein YcfA (HicA-like mRNA interferase family)